MPVVTVIHREDSVVDGLFFDGTMSTDHAFSLKMTSNPLEYGANATDHAYMEPNDMIMQVFVGDYWTGLNRADNYNPFQRSADALAQLRQIETDRQPIVVVTNLVRYTNLLLSNIHVNQAADTASTLMATLTFRQLIVVDDQRQDSTVNNDSDQHQVPKNSGTKQARPL